MPTDNLFHEVQDTWVICSRRGVYRQSKVYRRGEAFFAKHGAGFIKLCAYRGTSCPDTSWVDFEPAEARLRLRLPEIPSEQL